MQYRVDKKTGKELSILGMGCMRLPTSLGKIDMKKTSQIIEEAIAGGINYFDTAWIYPGSEQALGTVLAELGRRKDVYIATKMPILMCNKNDDFDKYFSESLKRLQTDYIDYYLMHNIQSFEAWERIKKFGVCEWIAKEKSGSAARIRQIGFSFHGNYDDFIKVLNDYDWDFCQIQYNYSDENYQAGRRGLVAAAEKNIPVIIMEPLMGGKLVTGLPEAARAAFAAHASKAACRVAASGGNAVTPRSPAMWGLFWIWDQAEPTVVLSGMSSLEQLKDNLSHINYARPGCLNESDKKVFEQVKAAFNAAFKIHCAGCNYCMPCPRGVNIPGAFSSYNTSYAIGWAAGIQQYVTSTSAQAKTNSCASRCINCGKCESHCPQHIRIREELTRTKRRFEPFYIRLLFAITRLFLH